MLNEIATKRIHKELLDLDRDPPPGITCFPKDDVITDLEAYIQGPPDSPYEAGLFKLSIQIPDRYPFQPPQIKFITSIYHPNIDDTGRICADILKTGEKGQWKPAINLGTALTSLRQLLAAPNPDDPLDAEIAKVYQLDYPTFIRNAIDFTNKYASKEAFDDEESIVSIQVENIDIEEEEPVKKSKSSLSLSKKNKAANIGFSTLNTQTSRQNSIKLPEDELLRKESKLGKSKQECEETHSIDHLVESKPAKKIKLGKSRKIEPDFRDSTVKLAKTNVEKNQIKAGSSKATMEDTVEEKDLEREGTRESTIKKDSTGKGSIEKDSTNKDNIKKDDIKKRIIKEDIRGDAIIKENIRKNDIIKKDTLNNDTIKKNAIEKNTAEKNTIEEDDVISKPMDIDVFILSDDDSDTSNEVMIRKRLLDASFFEENIIEISDTEDNLFDKPVFHSLQLSKKLKRNKLSLSKKRRQ